MSPRGPLRSATRHGAHRLGGRVYYGWVLVVALAITATTGYGILTYAFPVFLAPMEADLGWSRSAITGAFSVAMLVAGAVAIPVGRWVDRRGARGPMTLGSIAASALLLAWSVVDDLGAYYLVWIGLGAAMAAVLYEPAFAVVATWFVRYRGRALSVLTFVGGFASVVFVPLATWLVQSLGWRAALAALAAILAGVTIPIHAFLLRRRPEDLGLVPDGGPPPDGSSAPTRLRPSLPARRAVRSRSFRWLAVAFGLSSLATTAATIHLIPILLERGYGAGFAALALSAVGTVALPGRLVFTPLGDRRSRSALTASIFALQAGGIGALLVSTEPVAVWAFVLLFGAGFGAITPARAALLADLYGPAEFGHINGTLALTLSVARAAAPVGASAIHQAAGGYGVVLATLFALILAAGIAVLRTERRDGPLGPRLAEATP